VTAPGLIDLLRARARRGSRPPHGDGASIALAVEGGAMRGVISAGMVWALEDLHLTHAFDAIYGSSGGAINAAYFLAGQAGMGTTVYFEDINNRRFIDLRRALVGRPIVNLSFLLEDVACRRKPLAVDRVLAHPTPLSVIATDVEREGATSLAGFRAPADLFGALRASATMPIVAGGPHVYGGRRYLDASLSEPIPARAAEADGHTHVLVLLTRGAGMRPHPSAFDRYFVAPRLRRISPRLATHYLSRAAPYADLVRVLDSGRGPLGQARVTAIRVPDWPIHKLERRRSILEAGARRGYEAVLATFGEEGRASS
jgi:predicted patatin/cPLA2 family phospholipase